MFSLLSGTGARHPTVVLDIGDHSIKCGIAGEPAPRRIVPTNYLLSMTSLAAFAPTVKVRQLSPHSLCHLRSTHILSPLDSA